jgi:predicted ATPase
MKRTAAKRISLIAESYQLFGYDIVPVPVPAIKKGADFILQQI